MEYNYPIYKKFISSNGEGLFVVKFTDLEEGEVLIADGESHWKIGDIDDDWIAHDRKDTWEDYIIPIAAKLKTYRMTS